MFFPFFWRQTYWCWFSEIFVCPPQLYSGVFLSTLCQVHTLWNVVIFVFVCLFHVMFEFVFWTNSTSFTSYSNCVLKFIFFTFPYHCLHLDLAILICEIFISPSAFLQIIFIHRVIFLPPSHHLYQSIFKPVFCNLQISTFCYHCNPCSLAVLLFSHSFV